MRLKRVHQKEFTKNQKEFTKKSSPIRHSFDDTRRNHISSEVEGIDKGAYDWQFNLTYKILVNSEATTHERINEFMEPLEHVNEAQANLLGSALVLAMGGPAQAHVGTGAGGSSSELPWGEKKNKYSRGR